jgi:hypothetical protein
MASSGYETPPPSAERSTLPASASFVQSVNGSPFVVRQSARLTESGIKKASDILEKLREAVIKSKENTRDVKDTNDAVSALLSLQGTPSTINSELYTKNLEKHQNTYGKLKIKMLEQTTTIQSISGLLTVGATELALLIYGPERVAIWETNFGRVRGIFEINSSIPGQCNNTIGPLLPGQTSCWICGMIIPKTEDLPGTSDNGLAGECEHILPVSQASLFLELYDNVEKGKTNTDHFKLEYAWSHKLCNRTKNDDVYFKPELDANGHPVNDEVAFENLLNEIVDSKRKDSYVVGDDKNSFNKNLKEFIKTKFNNNTREWSAARKQEFNIRFSDIGNFIGNLPKETPGLYLLSLMSAVAIVLQKLGRISMNKFNALETGEVVQGLKNLPTKRKREGGAGRRTRRRTDRVFPKRHHSIKMSSIRHSLSGKAASR